MKSRENERVPASALDILKAKNQVQYCYHLLKNIVETIDDLETIESINTAIPSVIKQSRRKAEILRERKIRKIKNG